MIKINNINFIILILLAFLFLLSYIICLWLISRKKLRNDTIFDISIGTFFVSLLFGRLTWLIINWHTLNEVSWSLLPIARIAGTNSILRTLPWIFLNPKIGGIDYFGLIIGLIIGLIFIFNNSNKKKPLFKLFDWVVLSFLISSFWFLIISVFREYNLGKESANLPIYFIYSKEAIPRFPIQLFEAFISVFCIILFFVLNKFLKKRGVWTGLTLSVIAFSEIYFRSQNQGYQAHFKFLDFYQIIVICVLCIGIFLMIISTRKSGVINIKENEFNTGIPRDLNKPFIRKRIGNNTESKAISKFSMSFATNKISILNKIHQQEKIENKTDK